VNFNIYDLISDGINDTNWIINYLTKKVNYNGKLRIDNRKNINELNEEINKIYKGDEVQLLYKQTRGAWSSKIHRENKIKRRPKQINISISDNSKRKLDRLKNILKSNQDDIVERSIAIMYDRLLPSRTIKKSIPYINRDMINILLKEIKEKDKEIKILKGEK
tara:strand:- start:331 stop:819 length:489 start_codon:yes stop_codon:yes gene_type:complete